MILGRYCAEPYLSNGITTVDTGLITLLAEVDPGSVARQLNSLKKNLKPKQCVPKPVPIRRRFSQKGGGLCYVLTPVGVGH